MRTVAVLVTAILGWAVLCAAPAGAAEAAPASPTELPTVGCIFRPVPLLEIRQYCINVYGDGLHVDSLSGEIEVVSDGPTPITGAEVNAFGTFASGAPYSQTVVAEGLSSATGWFYPNADFQDGSNLCIRTKIGVVEWTDPVCVTIKR